MKTYIIIRKCRRKPDIELYRTTDEWQAGYALQEIQLEYPRWNVILKVVEQ